MIDWSDKRFPNSMKFSPGTVKAVQHSSSTMAKAIPHLLLPSQNANLELTIYALPNLI